MDEVILWCRKEEKIIREKKIYKKLVNEKKYLVNENSKYIIKKKR